MTKASDNAFPSVLITEGTVPSTPAAGKQRLYIDSTTHVVKVVNSSGAASNVGSGGSTGDFTVCQGRLTLTTAVPVTTSDVTAATTLYFTPFRGNTIGTYSGSAWSVSAFTEKSISLSGLTAGLPYDVFIVDSTLALELLAWTNGTTRATALTTQDGIYVKTGATTRRYLGTIVIAATGQCEDSLAKRLVWNYYNRVSRAITRLETTNSWSYSTASYHQANASTANQIAIAQGVAETPIDIHLLTISSHSVITTQQNVAIGEDSTTTPATGSSIGLAITPAAGAFVNTQAYLSKVPAVGSHFYAWLEYGAAGTNTWYGDDGGSPPVRRSGMTGTWWA